MAHNEDEDTVRSKDPYETVKAHNTVDYVLRTTQQNQMQLSMMADTKANIMITVTSIVISVMLSQLGEETFRLPLLTLGGFALLSLLLAILAVLPKTGYPKDAHGRPDRSSPFFNPLFFGHFSTLDPEEFHQGMADILSSDAEIYRRIAGDIYGQGLVMAKKKYRLLRYSYLLFLVGTVATGFEVAVLAALRLL